MKLLQSVIRTPAIVVVLILGLCAGLSTLGFVSWAKPQMQSALNIVIDKYDEFLPEIAIQRGQASIKKDQPYHVDFGQGKELPIVIDTREGMDNEALNYLKTAKSGFVLTRTSLVTKNEGELRVVPLAKMPDVVLDSQAIKAMAERYFPKAVTAVWAIVAMYFFFAKTMQALIFALIPFAWAKAASVSLSYGKAIKIAVFCIVPPILVSFAQNVAHLVIPARFYVYFGLYIALIIVSSAGLVWSLRTSTEPSAGTNP